MKKVLILAYDFPPYVSVGGIRPNSWLRYFAQFGYSPIVVTRQWSNFYQDERDYIAPGTTDHVVVEKTDFGSIYRAPFHPNLSHRLSIKYNGSRYRGICKGISAWEEFVQYFFHLGSKKTLLKAAEQVIESHEISLIIATGEPFVLFNYAAHLGKKHGIKWVADFRDPWSDDISRKKLGLLRHLDRFHEKRILKSASAITTVNEFFAALISSKFEQKIIKVIPNGYDQEFKEAGDLIKQASDKFRIALVGTIHSWHPWKLFLKTCAEFISNNPDFSFEIVFIGVNNEQEIRLFSNSLKTNSFLKFMPRTPNNELPRILAKMNVLLLFNYYDYIGTKIYNYLALKRLVIFCFVKDPEAERLKAESYNMPKSEMNKRPQKDLIRHTNGGILVNDKNHLISVLYDLKSEFNNTQTIKCPSKDIDCLSRESSCKALTFLFNELLND